MEPEICSFILPKAFTPHGITDILQRKDPIGYLLDLEPPCQRRRLWEKQMMETMMNRHDVTIINEQSQRTNRPKKQRTTFSAHQVSILETMFEKRKYINSVERSYISRWGALQCSQV